MRQYYFSWEYKEAAVNYGGTVVVNLCDGVWVATRESGTTPSQKVLILAETMVRVMEFKDSVLTLDGYTISAIGV